MKISIHKDLKKQNSLNKNYKKYFVILFSIVCFLFFSISSSSKILSSIPNKEYTYVFKISDKLIGTGEVNLSVENNEIKGTASGFGMTTNCNIDFFTDIKGIINTSEGDIKVSVNGKGKPQGLFLPGKVLYEGPLKGLICGKIIKLKGNVAIKGSLARMAGFKENEDLTIEITDISLAKALSEIQNSKKNLALYN